MSERLMEEDFHLSVCVRFRAHVRGRPRPHKPERAAEYGLSRTRDTTHRCSSGHADRASSPPPYDALLDAFAALWTAERIAKGTARTVSDEISSDSTGLPMRITM